MSSSSLDDLSKLCSSVVGIAKSIVDRLLFALDTVFIHNASLKVVGSNPREDIDNVQHKITTKLESLIDDMESIITEMPLLLKIVSSGKVPEHDRIPYLASVWNADYYGVKGIKSIQALKQDLSGILSNLEYPTVFLTSLYENDESTYSE